MTVQGSGVNFYPNDQIIIGAPVPDPSFAEPPMPMLENAWIERYGLSADEDYYSQAGSLFRLMDESQKVQLTTAIAEGLVHASQSARQRVIEQFRKADPDYAERVSSVMASFK